MQSSERTLATAEKACFRYLQLIWTDLQRGTTTCALFVNTVGGLVTAVPAWFHNWYSSGPYGEIGNQKQPLTQRQQQCEHCRQLSMNDHDCIGHNISQKRS